MFYSKNQQMHSVRGRLLILALIVIGASPLAIGAWQAPAGDKPASGEAVVTLASPNPLVKLLPDTLAGFKATGEVMQVASDNIGDLTPDKAGIYREYLVGSAVRREYAGARVEVFETRNQFAALGLFEFSSATSNTRSSGVEVGSGGARLEGELLFWKGNFLVRVVRNQKPGSATAAGLEAMGRAVADLIVPASTVDARPPLLDSLPASVSGALLVPNSQRYFLGPESLSSFISQGRDMFEFLGDTEAVAAEYTKTDNNGAAQPQAADQSKGASKAPPGLNGRLLRLVIVECHTPEFATDELAKVTAYVESLSEIEQKQIVFKRTGNYIIAAVNVSDRDFGENLINAVQYPYTVKWLRNPLWPTNDPFRTQKAAEMLLSTFGLLGLILLTVLLGGTIFGTSVFLKRRKQQQEIFSDAGGMLRLEIEPFVLGLPPKRED
jgi:uncharacterized protein DUF6599